MDALHATPPPCMDADQWRLYLSGVAATCLADKTEATRLSRSGRVNPCGCCTQGFKAEAGDSCRPEWFEKPMSLAQLKAYNFMCSRCKKAQPMNVGRKKAAQGWICLPCTKGGKDTQA